MLSAYSRCLITHAHSHPHRVQAAPCRWVAPSPRLHSPNRLPGVGLRGAWRPARCKHLHGALKAGLDVGQRLGSATGCLAPPGALLRRSRLLAATQSSYLPAICIGQALCGLVVASPPRPRMPMNALAQDRHPPHSNFGHLLSACCVPDPVLSPRERHNISILQLGKPRHKTNREGLVQGHLARQGRGIRAWVF